VRSIYYLALKVREQEEKDISFSVACELFEDNSRVYSFSNHIAQ
jgi:hypothetical protein